MAPRDVATGGQSSPKWLGWATLAMIVCLAVSIMTAAEALIPGWSGDGLLIGVIIAAIEAMYSFHVLRLPRSRGISMLRYRLAEACLLGVLLKLISYASHVWDCSWADLGADVVTMLWQPSAFFSGSYTVFLAAGWITWMLVNRTLADVEALYDPYLSHTDQQTPRATLMSRFYWGGGLLVLFIGVRYFAIDASGAAPPDTSDYHLNALLYFLLGMLILSHVRFASLMAGWRLQQIDVANGMGQAWTRYGLAFLALIVLIVAFLPTHYSMGLFDTVLLGLRVVVDLLRRVMELLILAITIPLSWLLSLFGQGQGGALPLPPIPETPPTPTEPKGQPLLPWEVIRALAFWLTFLAVVIYLIRSYLEDHPKLLQALKSWRLVGWLFEALAALIAQLAAWAQKGRQWQAKLAAKRLATDKTKRSARNKHRGGARSQARSDRERVIRAYLRTLQRAAAAGLRRQQHQTPYEYAPVLHRALPDSEANITGLTDVFVHARYSPEQVASDQAVDAVAHGDGVQRALRRLRHDDGSA